MVEEIFSTGIEDELSNLAANHFKGEASGSEDSQQIIKTLAVINYLKVTVLIIIGFIICKCFMFLILGSNFVHSCVPHIWISNLEDVLVFV